MGKLISVIEFEDFSVHTKGNRYCFLHCHINDRKVFYNEFFDCFFDEERLLKYFENNRKFTFTPMVRKSKLFLHLNSFLDTENNEIILEDLEAELVKILERNYNDDEKLDLVKKSKTSDKVRIRNDKIGKLGEFVFSIILSEYYGFDCIIPKLKSVSNKNMSIFGIDTLFYSDLDNMILFGESKISISLIDGIKLIEKSLKDYESTINNEFAYISNNLYAHGSEKFKNKFNDVVDQCIKMDEFLNKAEIKKVGIPIFVGHGNEVDVLKIVEMFSNIEEKTFLGLDTKYYFISMPLIDKNEFIANFIRYVKKGCEMYEGQR